jgi:hypothetical protein
LGFGGFCNDVYGFGGGFEPGADDLSSADGVNGVVDETRGGEDRELSAFFAEIEGSKTLRDTNDRRGVDENRGGEDRELSAFVAESEGSKTVRDTNDRRDGARGWVAQGTDEGLMFTIYSTLLFLPSVLYSMVWVRLGLAKATEVVMRRSFLLRNSTSFQRKAVVSLHFAKQMPVSFCVLSVRRGLP